MIKRCVICGKEFKSPPSSKVVTCSPECRSERARRAILERGGADILHTPKVYKKIKENPNMKERMKNFQAIGTTAAMQLPGNQKGIQNRTGKLWIIIDPSGNKRAAINIQQFVRDNAESFGIKSDDEKSIHNISSGFQVISRTLSGRNSGRPVYHCHEWGLDRPSIDFPEKYSSYESQRILDLWFSDFDIDEISGKIRTSKSFIEDVLEAANLIKKRNGEKMNKSEVIRLRVTPEFKKQIQKLAESENRTVSNYIENLIKLAIQNDAK